MTGLIVGAILFAVGVINQTHIINGATLLWVAGITIAATSAYRRARVDQ